MEHDFIMKVLKEAVGAAVVLLLPFLLIWAYYVVTGDYIDFGGN